jgi:hypothetical protein
LPATTTIATTLAATTTRTATAVAATAAFATAATTTVATSTAAVTTATATTTEAASTGRARFHGARFIDHNIAAAERLVVQASNGCLGLGVVAHFDKAKAFGSTGFAVHHDFGTDDGAILAKGLLQIVVTYAVGQVAHVQFATHLKNS